MEYPYRRGIAPWIWVLIVLAAIILVFVIWWAVAAQQPEQTIVTQPEETAEPQLQQPTETQQPVVVERERPVNIYIERERPQPRVIVVPRGETPPQARERLSQVNIPSAFRYQGKVWEPSDEAVSGDNVKLKDTGASIDDNIIYAEQGATSPYNELYLETEPGSGIYVSYTSTSS